MPASVTLIPPTPPAPRYNAITLDELELLPDPVWLIEHWCMRESVTVLVGKSESFKTFVAMDLAMKASDPSFDKFLKHNIDRSSATAFGGGLRVLYIIGESMGAAKFRFRAIKQHHKLKGYPKGLMVHPNRVDIMSEQQGVRDLVEAEDPDIVIFDTWSRNTYGMDENNKKDVDKALTIAHDLKNGGTRGGRSVIFIHHPPASDSGKLFRGHTALLNDTDIMVAAARFDEAKDNPVAPFFTKLKSMRQKETDDFLPYWARLNTHHLIDEVTGKPMFKTDGVTPKVSLVIDDTDTEPTVAPKAPKQQEVWDYVEAHPGATGKDIQEAVWGEKNNDVYRIVKELGLDGNMRGGFYVPKSTDLYRNDPTSTLEEL